MPSTQPEKLLVLDLAALGWDLVQAHRDLLPDLAYKPLEPTFPGLTCTVQASFRTGSDPAAHGMTANGLYMRALRRPMFWEQSCRLVEGERIWSSWQAAGQRVGLFFWQQSLGEEVDMLLSPRPIHKHGGGMIQDCFSRPDDLYEELSARVGRSFQLMHYWGPLASRKSSAWVTAALEAVMERDDAPELLLGYLPHLDYDLQRFGPVHDRSLRAVQEIGKLLQRLLDHASAHGYEVLLFGDYAIQPARQVVYPNRALREASLLPVRTVRGRAYPDFFSPGAFAMVDHEVAHIHVDGPERIARARDVLGSLEGVETVMDRAACAEAGIDHPNAGELVAVASPGCWFAYPWWTEPRAAPDYASHVDIHNKPGFDPCELFFGRLPTSVSQDTSRIGGSHGRAGTDRQTAWASTFDLAPPAPGAAGLGLAVKALR